MKYAAAAYLAAIILVGGLVTALTAPKAEEEEEKAALAKEQAALAKEPPPEMTAPEEVASRVVEIRGLDFPQQPPKLEIAPPQQVQQQLTTLDTEAKSQLKGEEKQRETTLEQATGILMAQTGAVPAKEATQASKQFTEPGAIAVYVPKEQKVLVSAEVAEGDPQLGELAYVHQLARALEAERFGETGRSARPFHDAESAELALQEGSAVLTAQEYAREHLDQLDRTEPISFIRSEGAGAERAPALRTYGDFGLSAGTGFVEAIHGEGGWEAVDEAHRDEPPQTTSEILHPDARGETVRTPSPSLETAIGKGFQKTADADIGELDTFAILRAGLDEEQARQAADGWAAGHFELWQKSSSAQQCQPPCRKGSVSVLVWRWDAEPEAAEFSRAIRRSLEDGANADPSGSRAWTMDDGGAALVREGRFTALAFAPDPPTAGRMAQAALAE